MTVPTIFELPFVSEILSQDEVAEITGCGRRVEQIQCPYPPATAKHDAFFAGFDGARKLYRAMEGK